MFGILDVYNHFVFWALDFLLRVDVPAYSEVVDHWVVLLRLRELSSPFECGFGLLCMGFGKPHMLRAWKRIPCCRRELVEWSFWFPYSIFIGYWARISARRFLPLASSSGCSVVSLYDVFFLAWYLLMVPALRALAFLCFMFQSMFLVISVYSKLRRFAA